MSDLIGLIEHAWKAPDHPLTPEQRARKIDSLRYEAGAWRRESFGMTEAAAERCRDVAFRLSQQADILEAMT